MSRRSRTLNRLLAVALLLAAGASITVVAGMLSAAPARTAAPAIAREAPTAPGSTSVDGPLLVSDQRAGDRGADDQAAPSQPVAVVIASVDERLAPEAAVAIGLAGLSDLFPATTDAERELLVLACKGSWMPAVTAYRAYAARNELQYDADLFRYLITLRSAGAFIEARKDALLRCQTLGVLNGRLAGALGPLVRAALFDGDDAVVAEALWQLCEHPQRDPAIYAQLMVIAEPGGPNAGLALATLAFLRDGARKPRRLQGGSLGCGDAGGSFSGTVIYRTRGSGDRSYNTDGYTIGDLPALRERYRSGNAGERVEVAVIVHHYGWPEAFAFVVEMLADDIERVRSLAISTLADYRTERAFDVLLAHFSVESEASLRRRIVDRVLDDKSGADWATRERLFGLAMRSDSGTLDRAVVALEAGNVPGSAFVIEAMVRDLFGGSTAYTATLVRALDWLWINAALVDLQRAIDEGVLRRETRDATALIDAIALAFSDGADADLVPLLERTLRHREEAVRLHAVRALQLRFGAETLRVLRACCAGDTNAVASLAVSGLRPNVEDARTVAFAIDVAGLRRRVVERALTRLIGEVGDVRYADALLVLIESPSADTRVEAVRAAQPLADVRHVDRFVLLLADPELHVVLDSIPPLLTLAEQQPIDAHALTPNELFAQQRRLDDRALLVSTVLMRLQAGDLDVLDWLLETFPQLATLGIAVPKTTEDSEAACAEIARTIADALGVPIGDPIESHG